MIILKLVMIIGNNLTIVQIGKINILETLEIFENNRKIKMYWDIIMFISHFIQQVGMVGCNISELICFPNDDSSLLLLLFVLLPLQIWARQK